MNKFLSMLVLLICTNLATTFAQNTTLEVDNQYPGWLSSKIPFKDQASVQNLTVTGYINGTDVKFIRELMNNRQLSHLDLSDANIVAGGDAYYIYENNYSYKIEEDNVINGYMFVSDKKMTYLSLPKTITKFPSVSNYCSDLDTLVIGGDVKLLSYYSNVEKAKKCLIIREGVDSLGRVRNICAKTVHLPSTLKYLPLSTFYKDTIKVNIENVRKEKYQDD